MMLIMESSFQYGSKNKPDILQKTFGYLTSSSKPNNKLKIYNLIHVSLPSFHSLIFNSFLSYGNPQ